MAKRKRSVQIELAPDPELGVAETSQWIPVGADDVEQLRGLGLGEAPTLSEIIHACARSRTVLVFRGDFSPAA